MSRPMYVYIMTNKRHTTLYVGMTNNLPRRVYVHRNKIEPGFTKKYNLTKLVYYESHNGPRAAIQREKQIKGGSRARKEALISAFNPEWIDLYDRLQAGGV